MEAEAIETTDDSAEHAIHLAACQWGGDRIQSIIDAMEQTAVERMRANAAPKLLLTIEEAAHTLSVSTGTVKNLVRDKALPATRIGRSLRFSVVALQEFIASNSDAPRGAVEMVPISVMARAWSLLEPDKLEAARSAYDQVAPGISDAINALLPAAPPRRGQLKRPRRSRA